MALPESEVLDVDGNSSFDDDDDPWDRDSIFDRFGYDELVGARNDPDDVQLLVGAGYAITPNAILAASHAANARSLEILLDADPDPNVRLDKAHSSHADVENGWEVSDLTPLIGVDKREWYPIQYAVTSIWTPDWREDYVERSIAAVTVILRYKPDLFATFRQPIWRPNPYPFPGEVANRTGVVDFIGDFPYGLEDWVEGEFQRAPDPEMGYGIRSVIHALVEDGACLKPYLGTPLDVSRQDPQGRTLLHSVCRNTVGADATIEADIRSILNASVNDRSLAASIESEDSLFHTVRKLGADLRAKDYSGKNILHHLFEARTPLPFEHRLPLIDNTLKYVVDRERSLINDADNFGTFPLHSALQRLRGLFQPGSLPGGSRELVIETLLDAGADPTAKDSRGNTALHYLADNGLTEQQWAAERRALCHRFCKSGVDVNGRNKKGQSALEILMDDDGKLGFTLFVDSGRFELPASRNHEDIDREVFQLFDDSGMRWIDQDSNGRTLLHVVAKHSTSRATFRAQYLLDKGVDFRVKDRDGKTAYDIAVESENKDVLSVFGFGFDSATE